MKNIEQYRAMAQPPAWALRPIQGGRLKGKTDINPQWRYQAMTELYGLCGIGWKFEVVRKWTEPGPDGQVFAFVDVNLYIRGGDGWSEPIPGNGGNMLVEKEAAGPHANDEAFKMAVTDALSTAMKILGIAADVYAGMWDGSKYKQKADPDAVVYVEIQELYRAWAVMNPEKAEGKDKKAQRLVFGQWVAETTGRQFDIGAFQQWTRPEFDRCQEALHG